MLTALKEKITKLEKNVKELQDENSKLVDRVLGTEKVNKMMIEERDRLKNRVAKLLQRKGKHDSSIKSCKNCAKEFGEADNFNWSCRTHQSEWGGELWWCCGKTTKDAPGCKFRKHETKDEESDEEDKEERDEEELRNKKNHRCVCCRELGHRIEDCTRDPNFKTNTLVHEDQQRINKIKNYKKLHVDSMVQQTHFIKKSVMVPINIDDDGRIKEHDNQEHPFMRGIMNFDDFSYSQFNSYVLIAEPHESEKLRVIADRKATMKANSVNDKDSASTLTQERLNEKSSYKHENISMQRFDADLKGEIKEEVKE